MYLKHLHGHYRSIITSTMEVITAASATLGYSLLIGFMALLGVVITALGMSIWYVWRIIRYCKTGKLPMSNITTESVITNTSTDGGNAGASNGKAC